MAQHAGNIGGMDKTRFQFIADALHGSGGFAVDASSTSSYLTRYPSETDKRYSRRNEVAWYTTDLMTACTRYVSWMAAKPPVRDISNPLLADMVDDADWAGTALNMFWLAFMVEAKARGLMFLLVDAPASDDNTRQAPYLAAIAPEVVLDYRIDRHGKMEFFSVPDRIAINGVTVDVIHEWDKAGWRVKRGGEVLYSGNHGLGVCPVLWFSESGQFGAVGEFAQIADMSKRLFNLRSELDEILRAQTFSLLTFPMSPESLHAMGETAAKVTEIIGTQNMLIHETGSAPSFIAPPDGPATVYQAVIKDMERKILDAGISVELPDGQEAAEAIALRYQRLNASLELFAARMEALERQMWELSCLWLGIAQVPEITWQKQFTLTDGQRELTELALMQAAAMPAEAIREKQRQVAGAIFGRVEPERLDAVISAIDEAAHDPA